MSSEAAVVENLVAEGDLPRAYVISRERMERCERIDSVQVQDRMGAVGVRSIDRLILAQRSREI